MATDCPMSKPTLYVQVPAKVFYSIDPRMGTQRAFNAIKAV